MLKLIQYMSDKEINEYCIIKTPHGYLGAVKSHKGLCSIILLEKTSKSVEYILKKNFKKLLKHSKSFYNLEKQMNKYFKGHPVSFRNRLDLDGASDFDKKVYGIVSTIPRGQTRNYGWVAKMIGDVRLSRAVGNSLGRNKLPLIIPCHRVTGRDCLGGFTPGIKNKRLLLGIEGTAW